MVSRTLYKVISALNLGRMATELLKAGKNMLRVSHNIQE